MWEGLGFAMGNALTNLVILVDKNGWQGFGKTSDVASGSDLWSKLTSFGG